MSAVGLLVAGASGVILGIVAGGIFIAQADAVEDHRIAVGREAWRQLEADLGELAKADAGPEQIEVGVDLLIGKAVEALLRLARRWVVLGVRPSRHRRPRPHGDRIGIGKRPRGRPRAHPSSRRPVPTRRKTPDGIGSPLASTRGDLSELEAFAKGTCVFADASGSDHAGACKKYV